MRPQKLEGETLLNSFCGIKEQIKLFLKLGNGDSLQLFKSM